MRPKVRFAVFVLLLGGAAGACTDGTTPDCAQYDCGSRAEGGVVADAAPDARDAGAVDGGDAGMDAEADAPSDARADVTDAPAG